MKILVPLNKDWNEYLKESKAKYFYLQGLIKTKYLGLKVKNYTNRKKSKNFF